MATRKTIRISFEMCTCVYACVALEQHTRWRAVRIRSEVKATSLSLSLSFSLFLAHKHPTSHRLSFIPAHPSRPQHPSIHPSILPSLCCSDFLHATNTNLLRTLRWFKAITLGDRKTQLRCCDWGLLKFISCGIRPEIKKGKKRMQQWRADWCMWMFMCEFIWCGGGVWRD